MHLLGIFCALGAGLFFGIIGPITKIAYNLGVDFSLAIFLRYLVATFLILPIIPFQKNLLKIYKKNIFYFLSITLGSIFLTIGLLVSVKFINVSLAILIFSTYPILVMLISIIIDREKISNYIKALFISAFLGLFLVLGPSFEDLNLIGVSLALLASIGGTIMIVINQKMVKKSITAIQINIFINIFNSVFFLFFLLLFFNINFAISNLSFAIILIPSLSYAIALFLQLLAIPRIGQSNTALFLYSEPTVAIIFAVFLLKEYLSFYQIIGSIIVLTSLILATYLTKKTKSDFS